MATNIAFVGNERQVNLRDPLDSNLTVINGIAGSQSLGGVTALQNGNFVAVYSNSYEGTADQDIMAMEFTSAGAVVASRPMRVDLSIFSEHSPDVTWRLGGGFAAVWVDSASADLNDTFSNFISIGVVPGGSSTTPTAFTVHNPAQLLSDPHIATFANGRYIVTYTLEFGPTDLGLRYAVLNSAGNGFHKSPSILAGSPVDEQNSAVAASGNLAVVAYQDEDGFNVDSDRITLKLIDSAGAILDTDVVADINFRLIRPDVAALKDGRFVIVYENPSTDEVLGRIYNPATKTFSGAAFQVTKGVGSFTPTVAGLPDGGFIVTWTGGTSAFGDPGGGILARRFDSGGEAAGKIFRINKSTDDDQFLPDIAVNASGRIFAAWADRSDINPFSTDHSPFNIQGHFLNVVTEVVNGTPNPDVITTYNLGEQINGLAGNDTINARGGGDTVAGDEGNDLLTGGPGPDRFLFKVKARGANADQITDFSVVDDTIALDNAVFKKLKAEGALKKKFFESGKHAGDHNDYVVYNQKNGVIDYDKNGDHKGGVKTIVTVTPIFDLTNADFLVV